MQALSDHFYWIILALGVVHAVGFMVLASVRRHRVRLLESHLANLVGTLSRRSDHDPARTLDERIETFIADIREVLEHPHSPEDVRRLYDRIIHKDELRRYLQGTQFETWYNVARTGIEIYPLLGIVGTVLAIGLGLNAPRPSLPPDVAVALNAPASPATAPALVTVSSPAAEAVSNSTNMVVRNFATSIWATLTGLVCAIIFMMWNAYLEPAFSRLLEHRTSVRNVINEAKAQLGLATNKPDPSHQGMAAA